METESTDAQDSGSAVNEEPVFGTARRLLEQLGVDVSQPGRADTPRRMVRALEQLLSGANRDPAKVLTLFDAEGYDQVIAVRDMPFVSICEHHVMPFTGTVSVAYLPGSKIVGLSKIPRLVRFVSRRLQVQERITQQVAKAMDAAEPRGVAVIVRGHHTCMNLRGIESEGEMVTSSLTGVFRDDASARAEAMQLIGGT